MYTTTCRPTVYVDLVDHILKLAFGWILTQRPHNRSQFTRADCTVSILIKQTERLAEFWTTNYYNTMQRAGGNNPADRPTDRPHFQTQECHIVGIGETLRCRDVIAGHTTRATLVVVCQVVNLKQHAYRVRLEITIFISYGHMTVFGDNIRSEIS